jgi:hypothetical protein
MTKKQASEAAERWNGESEATPREPADKYEITIIVSADDAEMKVNLPGIKREDIMAPGFDRAIQIAVQNFEHFLYGQPLPERVAGTVNSESPDSSKGKGGAE